MNAPGKEESASIVETARGIIDELTAVLAEEVTLLKKQDIEGMQELLRRKNELIIRYRSNMKALAVHPELLKEASPDVRAKLKAAGMKLAETTEVNVKSLKAATLATQRLIGYIIKHVKQQALPQLGYTDPRKKRFEPGIYSPSCPPLAVSRTA